MGGGEKGGGGESLSQRSSLLVPALVQAKLQKRWAPKQSEQQAESVSSGESGDEKSDAEVEGDTVDGPPAPGAESSAEVAATRRWPNLSRAASSGSRLGSPKKPGSSAASSHSQCGQSTKKGGKSGSSQPGTGNLTVDNWIERVNLQKIINGTKLGVDIHQSSLFAQKAESRERMQIEVHLALAEQAKVLSPVSLKHRSANEILQALASLEVREELEFPVAIFRRLWDLECGKRRAELLVDPKPDSVANFLEVIKPYPPGAGQARIVQKHSVKLWQLGLGSGQRCAMCMEQLLCSVLVELILEGESRAPHVLVVITELMKARVVCVGGVGIQSAGCEAGGLGDC